MNTNYAQEKLPPVVALLTLVFWLAVIVITMLIAFWVPPASAGVKLAWDNPNPVEIVRHITVYWGAEPRKYTRHITVSPAENNANVEDLGLDNATTIYFAVTATGNDGLESSYSNEVKTDRPTRLLLRLISSAAAEFKIDGSLRLTPLD